MNPVIEAIKSRRAVRAYEPKPVSKDIIDTIMEAGNHAPFSSITRSQRGDLLSSRTQNSNRNYFRPHFRFGKILPTA